MATITLKSYAYWLIDSVGLLSEALESLINRVAAVILLVMLSIDAWSSMIIILTNMTSSSIFPAVQHGIMFLLAAFSIAYTAWERLMHPAPLT